MGDIGELGAARGADGRRRCPWAGGTPEYQAYHDDEWGRPVTDDVRIYEKLCLEGFQSGLSWLTILRKREGFRRAFAGHAGRPGRPGFAGRPGLGVRTGAPGAAGARPPRRPGTADGGVGGAVESPAALRVPLRRPDDGLRRHAVAGAGERPPEGLPRPGGLRGGTANQAGISSRHASRYRPVDGEGLSAGGATARRSGGLAVEAVAPAAGAVAVSSSVWCAGLYRARVRRSPSPAPSHGKKFPSQCSASCAG
jgi:hypothetical protein